MKAHITGLDIQKADENSVANLTIHVNEATEESFYSQFDLEKCPTIPFEAIRISDSDIDLLKMVIMNYRGHRSLNILVSGPVGSGKTETVRCIVKGMGKTSLTVVSVGHEFLRKDISGSASRIRALNATLAHARSNHSVMLCDDADSLLKTFSKAGNNYGRISTLCDLLESEGNLNFFCVRNTEHIDPALMRRFDLILRLPEKDSERDRLKMWAAAVKKYSFEDYFSDEAQKRLARFPCDAGEIDRVLRNLCHLSGIPVDKMMKLAEQLIDNKLQMMQELDAELE